MCSCEMAKVFTLSDLAISKILIDNVWSGRGVFNVGGVIRTVRIRGSCLKYFLSIEPLTTVLTRIALRLPAQIYCGLVCRDTCFTELHVRTQIHKSIRSLSLLLSAPANLKTSATYSQTSA